MGDTLIVNPITITFQLTRSRDNTLAVTAKFPASADADVLTAALTAIKHEIEFWLAIAQKEAAGQAEEIPGINGRYIRIGVLADLLGKTAQTVWIEYCTYYTGKISGTECALVAIPNYTPNGITLLCGVTKDGYDLDQQPIFGGGAEFIRRLPEIYVGYDTAIEVFNLI